eukprot:scaffold1562_cov146-Isochrysis_galbana.AAC.4
MRRRPRPPVARGGPSRPTMSKAARTRSRSKCPLLVCLITRCAAPCGRSAAPHAACSDFCTSSRGRVPEVALHSVQIVRSFCFLKHRVHVVCLGHVAEV